MAFVAPSITSEDMKELLAQLFNSCLMAIGSKDPTAHLDDAQRARILSHAKTTLAEAFEQFIETVGKPKPQ